jgi:hypothetical protein
MVLMIWALDLGDAAAQRPTRIGSSERQRRRLSTARAVALTAAL